jgi:hypothetical protein
LQDAVAFKAFGNDTIMTTGADHYEVCRQQAAAVGYGFCASTVTRHSTHLGVDPFVHNAHILK